MLEVIHIHILLCIGNDEVSEDNSSDDGDIKLAEELLRSRRKQRLGTDALPSVTSPVTDEEMWRGSMLTRLNRPLSEDAATTSSVSEPVDKHATVTDKVSPTMDNKAAKTRPRKDRVGKHKALSSITLPVPTAKTVFLDVTLPAPIAQTAAKDSQPSAKQGVLEVVTICSRDGYNVFYRWI